MKWGRCRLSNFGRYVLTNYQNGFCPSEPNEEVCYWQLKCSAWVSSVPECLAHQEGNIMRRILGYTIQCLSCKRQVCYSCEIWNK